MAKGTSRGGASPNVLDAHVVFGGPDACDRGKVLQLQTQQLFALVFWVLPQHNDWEFTCNIRAPKAPKKPLTAAGRSLLDEVMDASDKMELQKEQRTFPDEA